MPYLPGVGSEDVLDLRLGVRDGQRRQRVRDTIADLERRPHERISLFHQLEPLEHLILGGGDAVC